MSEKKSRNNQRRKVLKTVVIGSGVLGAGQFTTGKWVKPVVDSVMLPAHAETTDDTGIIPGEVGARYSFIDPSYAPSENGLGMQIPLAILESKSKPNALTQKLVDALIPSAYAAPSSLGQLELFLEITAAGVYRFVLFLAFEPDMNYLYVFYSDSTVTLGNNDVMMSLCAADGGPSNPVVITINSVTPTMASVTLDSETFELLYDQNAVAPQNIACIVPPA